MKQILLITLGLSVFLHAEFTRAGMPSGVVKETVTQLQWQDDYSDNAGTIKTATWTVAIDYCEALGLAGGGWRLPNKKELLSLVDYTKYNPSIDAVFKHSTSANYWSSTTFICGYQAARVVNFYYGGTDNISDKSSTNRVRCVR